MTPITIAFQETGLLLTNSSNRQVLHQQVYTAISKERGKKTERDFIFSIRSLGYTTKQVLIKVRAAQLPESIPSIDSQMTFKVGDKHTLKAEFAPLERIGTPTNGKKEQTRSPANLTVWVTDLMARNGFKVMQVRINQSSNSMVSKKESKRKDRFFVLPSQIFTLSVEVKDPAQAASAWVNGVGRKKGYGFGLLEKLDD